jgi:TolB protein
LILFACGFAVFSTSLQGQISIDKDASPGNAKPVLVSLSGITGEAAQVIQFDLYVQGFAFTNAEAAQYLISGKSNGNLEARVSDRFNKSTVVAKAYSGATLRRQAHVFVDDFVQAIGRKGIAQTTIAFKGKTGKGSEIFLADFDGFNPRGVTADGSLVAAPSMIPGQLGMYYVSYKLNHADIFYQNLSSGSRKVFAKFGGSNMSPAASPDGQKVAMVLSKDGWPDLYVRGADGSEPVRLTKSREDESSPCWSPDGKWICYAAKQPNQRRVLCKIPSSGGSPQQISTSGAPSPTEPDWSPDGKWIAFTVQFGKSFQIYVVPAGGGAAIPLVEGEDPSWASNSRTLVFARRNSATGNYVLSLLDVPTKQYKDVSRISGSNSQSQPSWAR